MTKAALAIPAIPEFPDSPEWQDLADILQPMKYNMELREGSFNDDRRFVEVAEVRGFILDVYSELRGEFVKQTVKDIAQLQAGVTSDIHLSDITGDGIVTITADGQIVISAPGGLVIQDEGTLIIDTGDPSAPSGSGLVVGSVPTDTGWVLNQAGQFSWYYGLSATCIVLDDGAGAGIPWQRETVGILSPIDTVFKVYAGDQIIGGYNYKITATGKQYGGLYWQQSTGTFHIRGNIKNAVVDTGGILTVSNTGYVYIEASTANTGLLIGSLGAAAGWKINALGMFGYNGSGGVHAFSLANSVSWQGSTIDANDAVIGTYFTNTGVWWDNSAGKLYVKGEIVSGTVGNSSTLVIDGTGYVRITAPNNDSGLIVGDLWATANNSIMLNNLGLFMRNATGSLHGLIINNCTWQGQSLTAGDFVFGRYFNGSPARGLFWDDSEAKLYIKGNIQVATIVAGGIFELTSTGYIYINTSTANSGLLVGTITPSGGTGWLINSSGLFGYSASSGYFACALSSVSWDSMTLDTGDVMIGKYNSGKGILWDNSAGFLRIRGGLNVIDAESITMDTTGSFTMSAGTFSITGATAVSISAGVGLTIAAGSKITINSTDGIYFSTVARARFASTALYLENVTGGNTYVDGNQCVLMAGGVNKFYCTTATGNISTDNLDPSSGGSKELGDASKYWASVYADHFYWNQLTEWDDYDDLQLLRQIKPLVDKQKKPVRNSKGQVLTDMRTVPSMMTNRDTIHKVINEEHGTHITKEDVDNILENDVALTAGDKVFDSKEVQKLIFGNIGPFLGLIIGSARQMASEIDILKAELATMKAKLN